MQYAANLPIMPVICGPVEGTALGNTLVQIKSAGMVETLPQMRAIVGRSIDLVTYMPVNADVWAESYQTFLEVQKKYNE